MSSILLIDDDRNLRRGVRVALTAGHHVVAEAETAEAGVTKARQSLPDLILCDFNLGAGSGLDVLAQLRENPPTASIPLILITGSDDASVMRRSMDLGADDYLRKPFTGAELLAAVGARLRKQEILQAQAQHSLRDIEARHRLLFESSADAVMVLAPPAWKFVEANAATLRIFGARTRAEMLAAGPWDVSPEQQPDGTPSAAQARVKIEAALRDGSHYYEWTHRRLDGEVFPATVLLARLELVGQTLLQATVRDITSRKRAEQALEQSEARFRAIATAAPDAIVMMDPAGRVTFWNPAAERIFGYAAAEAVGADAHRLIAPPHLRPAFEEGFRTLQVAGLGAQVGQVVEVQALRKDGSLFAAELSISAVRLHDRWHAVGIVRDVTQQKETTRLLMQERILLRKLSLAVEQSPASVVITDPAGRIEYVNPKFCALTGYQPAEVLGQNPRVLKSGETSPEGYAQLWRQIRSGQEWRGELHNRKKNGELYWEFAVISPIKDEAGNTTHFLAVKEDITERKRTEGERNLMEVHLRQAQKLESIGQLAAGIAHEINTPMQYIGDNIRFLQESFGELRRVVGQCQELTRRG